MIALKVIGWVAVGVLAFAYLLLLFFGYGQGVAL